MIVVIMPLGIDYFSGVISLALVMPYYTDDGTLLDKKRKNIKRCPALWEIEVTIQLVEMRDQLQQ